MRAQLSALGKTRLELLQTRTVDPNSAEYLHGLLTEIAGRVSLLTNRALEIDPDTLPVERATLSRNLDDLSAKIIAHQTGNKLRQILESHHAQQGERWVRYQKYDNNGNMVQSGITPEEFLQLNTSRIGSGSEPKIFVREVTLLLMYGVTLHDIYLCFQNR